MSCTEFIYSLVYMYILLEMGAFPKNVTPVNHQKKVLLIFELESYTLPKVHAVKKGLKIKLFL